MGEALPRPFGPYELMARLGRGAAGAAYLARPIELDAGVPTPFVLKLLHAELAGRSDFVERFGHEAAIAVAVDSPHVAPVFDVGQLGDTLYIGMAYVPGWTLGRVLGALRDRAMAAPMPIVHALVAQGLLGLEALHAARRGDGRPLDAVHRDVSPKNLMVGEDGRVRVIDLGLMKSNAQSWQTRAGRVMGSPGYMAPEQARGDPVDRRADVYAMGVLCHELLTAERYIPSGDSIDMLRAALDKPYAPPSARRSDVPRAIDDALAGLMAKAPAARLQDAAAARATLLAAFGRPASEADVQAFLQSLLPDDYASRRQEVARLLARPRPEGPEDAATVVFVRRPGVSPEPEGTRVVPTRVVGGALDAPTPPSAPAATLSEMDRLVESGRPEATSLGLAPTEGRRRPWGLVASVALALGCGFAAGAWFMRSSPTPAPVAPPARVRPEAPAPVAAPAAAPSATPAAPVAPPPPPVEAARAPPPPRRPASPRPPAASPPPPPDVATRARRLQRRALQVKANLPEDDASRAEVDRILTRLTMLRAAGWPPDATGQIEGLEGALDDIRR